MATTYPNLIDGRPIDSTERAPDINPSNLHDVVGEFARGIVDGRRTGDRGGKAGLSKVVAHDAAGTLRHPRPRRHRDPRAEGRARPAARRASRASRSPTASAKPRARARSSSSSPARRVGVGGEKLDSVRPGHRGRGHARAGRRRRRDHAVEFSAGDSGVEDRARAGVRQLRRRSSRQSSCRRRRGRWSTSCSAPACRRAC